MSQQELKDRMKGSAVSTNVPGTTSRQLQLQPLLALQPLNSVSQQPRRIPCSSVAPVPPMPTVSNGKAPAPKASKHRA